MLAIVVNMIVEIFETVLPNSCHKFFRNAYKLKISLHSCLVLSSLVCPVVDGRSSKAVPGQDSK